MRILGLDPSTVAIGYALLCTDSDHLLDYGVYKVEGNALDVKLWLAHDWLEDFFELGDTRRWAQVLAIELPIYHRNIKTLRTLAQMVGALRAAAAYFTDQTIEVLPSERRLAMGITIRMKSKPAKDAIRRIVNQIYGLDLGPDDHDISDAVAVAVAAARKLRIEELSS